MKKESKASKIAGGFNDNLDIDKLASVANQMSTPPSSRPSPENSGDKASVSKVTKVISEPEKKDRRFTIIMPHDLYMKMVIKTKSEGISFTKYIHELMEHDLG